MWVVSQESFNTKKGAFGQQSSFCTCKYSRTIAAFILIGQSSIVATLMNNPYATLYSVLTNNFPFFSN